MSVELSFEAARATLKALIEQEPEFSNPTEARRFMLWRETQEQELVKFDFERAIASLRVGQPAILLWLDAIYQRVDMRLKEWGDRS